MAGQRRQTERELSLRPRRKTLTPRLYQVILHNDDYTTMEFVVEVLVELFHKSHAEATAIMLHVHTRGAGVCGIYTREVAETKVRKVLDRAREQGHPLLCTMEPADR